MSATVFCRYSLHKHSISLGYYDLTSVSVAIVVSNNTTHSAVTFIVNIQQVIVPKACNY